MSSITFCALTWLHATEWLVDATYCRSCVRRVIAGRDDVHLLAMLAR